MLERIGKPGKARVRRVLLALSLLGGVVSGSASASMDIDSDSRVLTVRVSGLRADSGPGRFSLYASQAAYDRRAPLETGDVSVTNGVCEWRVGPLVAGSYAIRFYHDLNNNGQLDAGSIGIPLEPMAFSNEVQPRFGPPRYKRMEFRVDEEPVTLDLQAFESLGSRGRIGLGLGVIVSQNPYEKNDLRWIPIPYVSYLGKRFSIIGPMARVRLGTVAGISFDGQVRYSFDGFDEDSSDRLRGMRKRRDTVMAGFVMKRDIMDDLKFSLDIETDVLDEHGGSRGKAGIAYTLRWGEVSVVPALGMEWLGAKTAAHLYGVSVGEANADRGDYRPGDTLSPRLGLGVRYSLTDSVSLFGNGGITFFDSAISDSPIVVRETVFGGFLALAYLL